MNERGAGVRNSFLDAVVVFYCALPVLFPFSVRSWRSDGKDLMRGARQSKEVAAWGGVEEAERRQEKEQKHFGRPLIGQGFSASALPFLDDRLIQICLRLFRKALQTDSKKRKWEGRKEGGRRRSKGEGDCLLADRLGKIEVAHRLRRLLV